MSDCVCPTGFKIPLRGMELDLNEDVIRQIVLEIVGSGGGGLSREEVQAMIEAALEGVTNRICVPDYANMESTNRIVAWNGTWTADRDGFVYCCICNGSSGNRCSAYINDKEAAMIVTANGHGMSAVLPVAEGDVIKITGTAFGILTTPRCYFIPPKFV